MSCEALREQQRGYLKGDDAVKSGFLQLCVYLPGELSLTHAVEGPQIFQLLAQQIVVHEQQHAQLPGNR